ncbi:unnamed protein product [Lathyrus sativus]|nr:unnamed protein product [Lathyrus sativus]
MTNPNLTDSLPTLYHCRCMASSTKKRNPTIIDSLLHTLTFDLKIEILSRLPVKLLLQLTLICKSLNSIIFNPNFVQKHLSISTTRRLHLASYSSLFNLKSYPLQSLFTGITTNFTQLGFPFYNINTNVTDFYYIACSCHGILCLADHYQYTVVLWNPSVRKFKILPPFEYPKYGTKVHVNHGFGYDRVSGHYKVVVRYHKRSTGSGIHEDTTTVKVLTLGTDYWKTVPTFPFGTIFDFDAGKCVSGTINWLAYTKTYRVVQPFIVSFDLAKESFQKIFLPHHGRRDGCNLTLLVWKDCLGIICDHDVWVMKTYGVQESWTKLFSVSYLEDPRMSCILTKALYIFEDDKLLLELQEEKRRRKLIVYNPKNGTFKVSNFIRLPEVCVQSLLSPDII